MQGTRLRVRYSLAGDIHSVLLPAESGNPSRKGELWKQTCLEFFLALKGRPRYWEFNFSPSGDWNVYRMEGYRRIDFREEASIQHVRPEISRGSDGLTLDIAVDISSIVQDGESLEMSVTAVIQTKDGNETYWALTHPASQADFHDRRGFILAPERPTHSLKQSDPVG